MITLERQKSIATIFHTILPLYLLTFLCLKISRGTQRTSLRSSITTTSLRRRCRNPVAHLKPFPWTSPPPATIFINGPKESPLSFEASAQTRQG
eukprot:22041_6